MNNCLPIFISIVLVLKNQALHLNKIICESSYCIEPLVVDYELIIVDNASNDESVLALKKLTAENGMPNLQVFVLTKEVDADTAAWVGLENALGDFVVVIDPLTDDIAFIP